MFQQHPLAVEAWPSRHLCYRRSVGEPLPTSVEALEEAYGGFLKPLLGGTGKGLPDLLPELVSRGALRFDWEKHLPAVLDCNGVFDILAVTYGSWMGYINRAVLAGTCPRVTNGKTPTSLKAVFVTKDIVGLRGSAKYFNKRPTLYPPSTVRMYEDFLRALTDQVVHFWQPKPVAPPKPVSPAPKPEVKASKPSGTWPIGVPRTYDALYREHRPFVEKVLSRYFRPGPWTSIEDARQHIWLKLVESRIIERFVEKARFRKLSARLTAEEAVLFLGITWDQWLDLITKDLPWLQPVEGAPYSSSAVFTGDQIRMVEESGLFPIRDAIPAEDMGKVFRGYVQNAIHNHVSNYIRTLIRRHVKDMVVPDDNGRVSNGHLLSGLDGDTTSWVDSLEDPHAMPVDLMADLPDVGSIEGLQEFLVAGVKEVYASCPGRDEDVFRLIQSGMTLSEAIQKVRSQIRLEKIRALGL